MYRHSKTSGGPDSGLRNPQVDPGGGCAHEKAPSVPPHIRASNSKRYPLKMRTCGDVKKFWLLMLWRESGESVGRRIGFNRAVFIEMRTVGDKVRSSARGVWLTVPSGVFPSWPNGHCYAWAKLLSFVASPCQKCYLRTRRLLTEGECKPTNSCIADLITRKGLSDSVKVGPTKSWFLIFLKSLSVFGKFIIAFSFRLA